jgi:hypothetical protein
MPCAHRCSRAPPVTAENVPLEIALAVSDADNSSRIVAFVVTPPQFGVLRQLTADASGELLLGDAIPNPRQGSMLEQWAIDAQASSFWSTGAVKSNDPFRLTGPPDGESGRLLTPSFPFN